MRIVQRKKDSSRFSSNSEANATELLDDLEEMFSPLLIIAV